MSISKEIYLSVVVPAYNEQRRLPKTLGEISRYLTKQNYVYEILVVNDGSKDKTAEVVIDLMSEIKNLRLVDNKENKGKGAVVKQGMLEAKGKFRVFTDADNSTSIDQVEKMWPEFNKGFDVVIGSRDIKGAVLDPPQAWYRILLGNTFNLLVQILCGFWGIWDTQCGFKGFTEKATIAVFPKCKIDRFAFDPEILMIAKKLGYKIKEVPIHWKNDPESKVKLKSMLKMGIDLLKIRWNLIKGEYD